MKKQTPMTLEGKLRIENELAQLIRVDREAIKKAISDARELGDLKENSEYHSAKEKQAIIEGRISQLQGSIANAKPVDISQIENDKIVFGATITLYDEQKDKSVIYQLVGPDESNLAQGRISLTSPLGKALLGKEEGDEVIVQAPKGKMNYVVEEIEYK